MKINNKSIQCLVDSGSISSVISYTLACKLGLKISDIMPEGPLVTASGEQLKVVGTTDILFSLKGLQISHNFVVIRDLYPALILGTDFLQANNASIVKNWSSLQKIIN